MFKQLRMKIAQHRVERAKARAMRGKSNPQPRRVRDMVMRPVHAVWAWLRCIDLIAMVNLTLLVAIIVLFSMLILDLTRPAPKTVVVVNSDVAESVKSTPRPQITVTDTSAPKHVRARRGNHVMPASPDIPESDVTVVRSEPAAVVYDMYGDIIVDKRYGDTMLTPGVRVSGNVYLQNMRQYTLPCGAYINGNLFLRDVGMLKFCGDFVVTGNIYVNRNSSFGPIPSSARLGGQVML